MGDLKNQIFLQYINKSLDLARQDFVSKHIAKKENRFLIKGITYEIGPCRFENERFVFEISSKIPQDLFTAKSGAERYFHQVVKRVNESGKKPADAKMENIVHNTMEMEYKERDYVKLQFQYAEKELYSQEEVDRRFKKHQSKGIPIPEIPGITTPWGKLVILIVEEKMLQYITQNVNDLVKANEDVKRHIKELIDLPEPKRKEAGKAKKAAKPKAAKAPATKKTAKAAPRKTAAKAKTAKKKR